MDSEELRCLIGREEGAKLDFKSESKVIYGGKVENKEWDEFIKDILSITNGNIGTATETGYLIIGAGNKLKLDGTRDLRDVGEITINKKQILDKVNSACNPRIAEINCELVSLDGKYLFVISIPPSPFLHTLTRDLQGGYRRNNLLIRRKDGEEIYVADDEEKVKLRQEKDSIIHSKGIMSIDDLVQQVRSQCCDKIQNLYSKIKLLNGKRIDVDQLYVDVYLLKSISSETFATMESLLQDSNLGDNFDRVALGQRGDRDDGFAVAKKYNKLMILGQTGAGKTTFLRHLAIACCQGEFKSEHIPILIELRSIKNASQFNLLNEIHQEFDLPDQEQTKQILKQGKVLIFLDGLDEVPSDSRRNVQKKIEEFSRETQYYKNHFILTCRTQTTEYTLENFDYVEVAEFKPQQVEKFAENWFATLTPQQCEELTAKFLATLRLPENKQIADLAVTPILLSLTCWIFGESKNLPFQRSKLYKSGIKLLLEQWHKDSDIQRDLGVERYRNLSLDDKQKLLSYVANRKFNQEQYALFEETEIQTYIAEYLKDISTNESLEVLKAIEAQHGLLIKRAQGFDSAGIYSFSHLTFQEYFTAQYIIENERIEQLVKGHLTDPRWREVFLLVAELMGDNACDLLSLMQEESQNYINTPKLQALLNWADEITSGTGGAIQPVGKRAIAIGNVYSIAITNAYTYYDTTYVLIAKTYGIANPFLIVSAYACAYTIANFDFINQAIEATRELEILQIFNYEKLTKLSENLDKLKSNIPNQQPLKELNKWAEEFRIILLDALNLTPEIIDLSEEELETLKAQYLYTTRFMIDCKKAAIGETSPSWWQEIETRMLKSNL